MIEFVENNLDTQTYTYLRQQVGWKSISNSQARRALDNSLYYLVVYMDDKPIGMGRLVGDGAVITYIQDLIVIPSAQGNRIGSSIIDKLIEYVRSITEEDTEMMLCLMSAKGRERFYQHHNFISRPTDTLGPGMIQYLYNKKC